MKNLRKVIAQALALPMLLPAPSFAVSYDGNEKPQTNSYIENHLLDGLPFVFTIPKSRQLGLDSGSERQINRDSKAMMFEFRHSEAKETGLRLYFANNKPRDRKDIIASLKKKGLMQSGDVVLKFHPEWGYTGGYPTVMAGISHAGYIFEKSGKLYNADMPLNAKFNRDLLKPREFSALSSSVWQKEAHYVHILRPKKNKMNDRQRKRAGEFAEALVKRNSQVYPSNICFNGNYMVPGYALNPKISSLVENAKGDPAAMAEAITTHSKEIAAIAQGDRVSTKWVDAKGLAQGRQNLISQVCVFCSDFAWSIAALRNCDIDQSINACRPEPIFAPIPIVGSGLVSSQGYKPGVGDLSYLVLSALNLDPRTAAEMVKKAFTPLKPYTNISSGHRTAAKDIPDGLYQGLAGYTSLLLAGQDAQAAQVREQIYQQMRDQGLNPPDNYSPNAFLVNAVLPDSNPYKSYDYVATVAFLDDRVSKKVLRMAETEGTSEQVDIPSSNVSEGTTMAVPDSVRNAFGRKVGRCTGKVTWDGGATYHPAMGPLGFGDCQDVRQALGAEWMQYVNHSNKVN